MKFLFRWYKRPVTVISIFLVFMALGAVMLLDIELGPSGEGGKVSYAVIIQHYGIDPEEIERSITKPLEDAIFIIPGIDEIRSTSEYGKSRVNIILSKGAKAKVVYLQLRDAVDRIYRRLPSSVQKPRVISSSISQRPVFNVSFKSDTLNANELRNYVEKNIKPSYEKIFGVGEIEIGGGEVREIHVKVDEKKAALFNITIQDIASFIQKQDILSPVGKIHGPNLVLPVSVYGRLTSIEDLRGLYLPLKEGLSKTLGDLAEVTYGTREKDTISRVNQEKRIVLYIQSSGSSNLVTLSRELRTETTLWEKEGFDLEILLDTGKKIEESIFDVIKAIIMGMTIVMVFLGLFLRKARVIVLLGFSLPITALLTASLLSFFKISLDHYILSGLAVGIGMIIDSGIILTQSRGKKKGEELNNIVKVVSPIVSSTITTLIVLIPLYFMEETVVGIRQVTQSIALLLFISLILNLVFLPPFLKAEKEKTISIKKPSRIKKKIKRVFYGFLKTNLKYPVSWGILFVIIIGVALFSLLGLSKDMSGSLDFNSLFAHIEFPSGMRIQRIDQQTSILSSMIKKIQGVERVQLVSKRGHSQMTISYDDAVISRKFLVPLIKNYAMGIPDAFLYLPEGTNDNEYSIEIAITGDDYIVLQDLAREAAQSINAQKWSSQTVLHFKDPPPAWVFKINHKKVAGVHLLASQVSSTLRWFLHGPVAVKWIENNREMDLRVMGLDNKIESVKELEDLPLKQSQASYVALKQLGRFIPSESVTKIFRKNRQRVIFFTARIKDLSLEESVNSLWKVLGNIKLPKAYAFELDKRIMELDRHYKFLWGTLILAIILIYMVLAAQSESLSCPFLILSILPPSLAFPLTALWISASTITIPVIVGLVIISGIIVNNSIIIIDNISSRIQNIKNLTKQTLTSMIILSVRKRIKPLFLTSGTTVLGTLPLLFFATEASGFTSTLAFVVFWGITGAVVSSLIFLPALVKLFFPLIRRTAKLD